MSKDGYSIDDILLEAQKLRAKAEQGNYPKAKKERELLDTKLEDARNLAEGVRQEGEKKQPPASGKPTKLDDFSVEIESFKVEQGLSGNSPSANEPFFPKREIPQKFQQKTSQKEAGSNDGYVQETKLPTKAPTRTNKKIKKKKNQTEERVDLFDFQLEKREKPIKNGPFGQKFFNFNEQQKQPQQPPEPEIIIKDEISQKLPEEGPKFDFDSISNKIDQLNHKKPVEVNNADDSENPFETKFGRKNQEPVLPEVGEKSRIRNRYNKLVFGKDQTASQETGEVGATTDPDSRKSIFSTFATGTGRELKIEDIKKIDFSALEGAGGYYDDEDDEDNFSQDIPDKGYIGFNEYLPKSDRRDVARDIANTKLGIFVRTAVVLVVTIILFYIAFSAKNENLSLPLFMHPEGNSLSVFVLVPTILTGLLLVICGNTAISGLASLVKMRANSDSLVTFSIIGAVVQGIAVFRDVKNVDITTVNLLFPIAALVLLFNYIGKLSVLSRIQRNFRITASNRERRGVSAIDSPAYCRELIPKITESQPTVAYSSKVDFFNDFLALSFSSKYDVGINRAVAPVCIVGAIIVALVTRLLSGSGVAAATAFGAVLCICATLSSTFVENIPLSKMSKNLTPLGAMVSGNKAVEAFCDTNAIVLSENELFPKGHVYLNGIKAFPNGRIDEAILDAASVLCALGGSIGYLFLDMIGGNEKLLKKVDNVVYENNMGLSGWVDGRRVLIGNRMLMQNHGVKLPNDSYEKAHPKDTPGNPIYLSNTGEVSARFLVEYTVDEELAYQLDQFAAKEKELIVYTTDANIDANKIWEIYSYPADLITIMSSELQDEFREMSQPKEEMAAEIVYTGKPASFVAAILATISARSAILVGTVIQLVQIIFGYGMVALMAFMGYLDKFGTLQMMGYQLIWFAIIYAVQQAKKV